MRVFSLFSNLAIFSPIFDQDIKEQIVFLEFWSLQEYYFANFTKLIFYINLGYTKFAYTLLEITLLFLVFINSYFCFCLEVSTTIYLWGRVLLSVINFFLKDGTGTPLLLFKYILYTGSVHLNALFFFQFEKIKMP